MTEYSDKLKNPRWQKKRLEIFERDGWTCQVCFDNESMLVVHHKIYLKEKEPWEYPNELLITLCGECHDSEKTLRLEYEESLLEELRKKFFTFDILSLAYGIYQMKLLHPRHIVASAYGWAFSSPDIQQELIDRYFNYIGEKDVIVCLDAE